MRARLKKLLVRQQDQSDCGVACLSSILKFYGGNTSLEHLRLLCGTVKSGTTLLGLYEGATKIGLKAKGVEINTGFLRSHSSPCILNVVNPDQLSHFVVFFGTANFDKFGNPIFWIGDPGRGLIKLNEHDLNSIWNKFALLIEPIEGQPFFIDTTGKKKNLFRNLLFADKQILYSTFFLSVIIAIIGLTLSIFSQQLIDIIIPSKNTFKLAVDLLILFILLSIKTFLGFLRQHFLLKQGKAFNERISGHFLQSILHLPKTFFDSKNKGDLMARLGDVLKIQRSIAFITTMTVIDCLVIGFTVTYIYFIAKWLSIALITFIPIAIYIALKFSNGLKEKQSEAMRLNSLNEESYLQIINGIITIKSTNSEGKFYLAGANIINQLQTRIYTLGQLNNKISMSYDYTAILYNLIIIGFAAMMVIHGQISAGEMIAVIGLTSNLLPSMSRLSQVNLVIQESLVAFERMADISLTDSEYDQDHSLAELHEIKSITIEGLFFSFPGKKKLLEDINIRLTKGQIVSVVGKSGCGKSTFLQLLEKFYLPTSGIIKLNDLNINNIKTSSIRQLISYLSQESDIYEGSIVFNIALSNSENELIDAYNFLKGTEFDKFFNHLSQGIFSPATTLSGGQKQLLAFIRAIFRKPNLLLIDEATSFMDKEMLHFVNNWININRTEMIILFVTHSLDSINNPDLIYNLHSKQLTKNYQV